MAQVTQEKLRVVRNEPDTIINQTEPAVPIAARITYLLGGLIIGLLGLRFILSLLGANRENDFASAIYGLSQPFVAPFFGLFNYQTQYGVVRFEFETLIAMLFWGFVTWLLVRLFMLPSERR